MIIMHFKPRLLAIISVLAFTLFLATAQSALADSFIFTRNLSFGSIGQDVKELQKYLNNKGFFVAQSSYGSPGQETTFFGRLTQAALIKFQKAKAIVPAWGFFGPITRKVVNTMNVEENINPIQPLPQTPATNVPTDKIYYIGGSITGITSPVTLQNNNGDDLTIKPGDNSNFIFPAPLADGDIYNITIKENYLGQKCYLYKNEGIVSASNVTSIKIACGVNLYFNPFTTAVGQGSSSATVSSFNCGDALVDTRDSQSYPTVLIGNQCWMAANINVGTKITNGSSEPSCHDVSGSGNWSCQVNNSVIEKYCYDNNDANCTTDGALYEWAEMLGMPYDCNDSAATDNGNGTYTIACPTSGNQLVSAVKQGICPTGWHLPTFNEYQTLAQNADPGCDLKCTEGACSCTGAGGKLKATAAHSPIAWDGTDVYNFAALPAGRRHYGSPFLNRGSTGFFWTTIPNLVFPGSAWFVSMGSGSTLASGSYSVRTNGFSVRCIKD